SFAVLTFPTKVLRGSLGRIGNLKRSSDKSLFPMALGSCGHRITHQLRPIIMNGRSILSETSVLGHSFAVFIFLSYSDRAPEARQWAGPPHQHSRGLVPGLDDRSHVRGESGHRYLAPESREEW